MVFEKCLYGCMNVCVCVCICVYVCIRQVLSFYSVDFNRKGLIFLVFCVLAGPKSVFFLCKIQKIFAVRECILHTSAGEPGGIDDAN